MLMPAIVGNAALLKSSSFAWISEYVDTTMPSALPDR
jgi:hypothetical protein